MSLDYELTYELTIEDDLNAKYTNWLLWLQSGKVIVFPARYFPLLVCISSIGLIVWGFLEPPGEDRTYLFSGGGFGFFISILLFFLYRPKTALSSFNRRDIKQEHGKYSHQQRQRTIVLTAEEFIFKTSNSEIAWSWQALKLWKEAEKGFEFYFYSGHKRFIPKRAFTDQQELDEFRYLIEQYQQMTKDER